MSKQQHTPAPWKIVPIGKELYIESDTPALVCDMQFDACISDAEERGVKANARLIAAAPELLEACRDILPELNRGGIERPKSWAGRLCDLIAKATGGDV